MEIEREKSPKRERERLDFHTGCQPSQKGWPWLPGASLTHGPEPRAPQCGAGICRLFGPHGSNGAGTLGPQLWDPGDPRDRAVLLSPEDSLVPLLLFPLGTGKMMRAEGGGKLTDTA